MIIYGEVCFMYISMCVCCMPVRIKMKEFLLIKKYISRQEDVALLFLFWENGIYVVTLLEKEKSPCAPIQDNQVILVLMPSCISPPAP